MSIEKFMEYNGIQVSIEDVDLLTEYRWGQPTGRAHIRFRRDNKTTYLHKLVGDRIGLVGPRIRHKDKNRLNCQRTNLISTTVQEDLQNAALRSHNTSGATGVCWEKARKVWYASIKVDGRLIYLGRFARFSDALQERERAESKYFNLREETLCQ